MSSQTLTRDQALHRAVQFWNDGSQPESKRLIFEVLKQAPRDAQSRALYPSVLALEMLLATTCKPTC